MTRSGPAPLAEISASNEVLTFAELFGPPLVIGEFAGEASQLTAIQEHERLTNNTRSVPVAEQTARLTRCNCLGR